MNIGDDLNYTFVSFDTDSRVCTIQVVGCVKQTLIEVPTNVVEGSQAWNDLLQQRANDVTANMDPMNSTYDPSLVGS